MIKLTPTPALSALLKAGAQAKAKLDNISGAGVNNNPDGITVGRPRVSSAKPLLAPPRLPILNAALVKVTGNATGSGVYNGRTVTEPASGLNPAVALAEGNMGTVFGSDNCYVINGAEVGQATHDLTAGTPVAKLFVAILQRTPATDGKPVYAISGYDWKVCT